MLFCIFTILRLFFGDFLLWRICFHIILLYLCILDKRRSPEKPIVAVNFKGKRQEISSTRTTDTRCFIF